VRPVGLRLALPPPPGDAPLRPAGMLADIPCRDALRRELAPKLRRQHCIGSNEYFRNRPGYRHYFCCFPPVG
jgi:hypothetical protein